MVTAPVRGSTEATQEAGSPPAAPQRPDDPAAAGAEPPEVGALRGELDRIDRVLVQCIAERVRVARAVGRAKRSAGMPVLDPAREAAVVRQVASLAREAGVDQEEVRDIFWRLIGLSRRSQGE